MGLNDLFQLKVLLGRNLWVLYPSMCLYVFKLGIVLNLFPWLEARAVLLLETIMSSQS